MIRIRKATDNDRPELERLLDELDLGHESLDYSRFIVAEEFGRILGCLNAEDCGPCFYVSAVGVAKEAQGKGVARVMMQHIIDNTQRPIYVYTAIPEFFSRFGFEKAEPAIEIPPKSIYDCESCEGRERCCCMVRRKDASSIS